MASRASPAGRVPPPLVAPDSIAIRVGLMELGYQQLNIYDSAGWLNIDLLADSGAVLIVLIGARRIGKTYGVLYKYLKERRRVLYLRLSKVQLDRCASGDNNPFSPPASALGLDTVFEQSGETYQCREVLARENGKVTEYGETLAQGSSVFSTRGIASGLYDAIVFDEFIPERGAIERKDAGYNLKSAIQTVTDVNTSNIQCWLLANSNNLDSDVLNEFDLIPVYEELRISGNNAWFNGSILCIDAKNSPVSAELAKTQLGQILNTGTYGAMAFDNDWSNNFSNVGKLSGQVLREYADIIIIGDIKIMGHKSDARYYVRSCKSPPRNVHRLEVNAETPRKCSAILSPLIYSVWNGGVQYDSFDTKRKFNNYVLGGKYKL